MQSSLWSPVHLINRNPIYLSTSVNLCLHLYTRTEALNAHTHAHSTNVFADADVRQAAQYVLKKYRMNVAHPYGKQIRDWVSENAEKEGTRVKKPPKLRQTHPDLNDAAAMKELSSWYEAWHSRHCTAARERHNNRQRPGRTDNRTDTRDRTGRRAQEREKGIHVQYARSRDKEPIFMSIKEQTPGEACKCPPHYCCDACAADKMEEGELAAFELEHRFHASTNVQMGMDRQGDDEMAHLLDQHVHVSDEQKEAFLTEWASSRAAHTHPLYSCASCGIRDPYLNYHQVAVDELPSFFELSPEQYQRRKRLQQPVDFAFPGRDGDLVSFRPVDISKVLSCFEAADGRVYHLHQELVDGEAANPTVHLCKFCYKQACENSDPVRPKMSLANGVDYGVLSRIPELDKLSCLEEMLLSEVRLYHIVAKVIHV